MENSLKYQLRYAFFLCFPGLAAADSAQRNGWYAEASFAAMYPDQTLYSDYDLGLRLNLGKELNDRWFTDLGIVSSKLKPRDAVGLVDEKSLDLNLGYRLTPAYLFQPYASVGAGVVRRNFADEDKHSATSSLGLGYFVNFKALPSFKLVNEFRGRYSFTKFRTSEAAKAIDAFGLIGLRYSFPSSINSAATSRPIDPYLPPPQKAPTLVEATVRPTATSPTLDTATARRAEVVNPSRLSGTGRSNFPDGDQDGVSDDADRCLNTIPGVFTDADGCMIARR